MAAQLASERQHVAPEHTREWYGAIEEALGRLACDELVIAHNATVYAIVGNVKSPTLLEDIQQLKGDPSRMTVGWTTPFRQAMHMVDTDAVEDRELRTLLTDTQALSRRFAALGFVCMPVKESVLHDPSLPAGVVSHALGTVQPYSPTGNDFTSRLIRMANARGMELVMTSANYHGEPEIVMADKAQELAQNAPEPLMVLEDSCPADEASKPLGSYPIIAVRKDKLEIVRPGCFTTEVITRLFDGYPIDSMPDGQKAPRYPDNVFGMEDLNQCYQEYDLKGDLLRLGILATLGWQADARYFLAERLAEEHPLFA